MVCNPVVPGYPSHVTCTGAGLRAMASRRLSDMWRQRSTRMSISSARISSASDASVKLTVSRQVFVKERSFAVVASGTATSL